MLCSISYFKNTTIYFTIELFMQQYNYTKRQVVLLNYEVQTFIKVQEIFLIICEIIIS